MSYFGAAPTGNFISTASQRVTGSTNNYVDLDHAISALSDVIVLVNSVKQDITNLTFTSGSRITLGGTLVSSDVVEIIYLGKSVATQTPGTGTVTNDMLAGSIANSKLANSSITLNGSAVSLGGSASVGGTNTPAFHASSDNTLSVSNNTNTNAACNVEAFDSNSKYDTSTFRFTPGETGRYFFYIQTRISESSGRIQVALYKNGSVLSQSSGHIEMENSGAGNNTFTGVNGSCITNCTSTSDYFEAFVWHKDGSTKNMTNRVFLGYKIIE